MQKATITIEEAGKALGIGRNSAYQAAHRGEIPVIKVGRRFLVPRAALERLLAGEAESSEVRTGEEHKWAPQRRV